MWKRNKSQTGPAGVPDGARRRVLGVFGTAMLAGLPCLARADDAGFAFNEIYKKVGVLGMEVSDKLRALSGKHVRVLGYMAPPLKPDARFFVLTRAPVSICPFCNSDADWPSDIIVVYLKDRLSFFQDGTPIAVSGTLELGSKTDSETGFVSQIRVVSAEVTRL